MSKLLSLATYKAHLSAGADEAKAEQAATDVGWLISEFHGLKGRVNLLILMVFLILGILYGMLRDNAPANGTAPAPTVAAIE